MTTIGVAIAVPEPWRSQLQGFRERIGDPMAALIPPHITLLTPTEVSQEALGGIELHLASAAGGVEPFLVSLRGTESFRTVSPVVYLPLVEGAEGCEALESRVRSGPLAVDSAFPYHPHVTVAHHVSDPILDATAEGLAPFSADFTVDAITLYLHAYGAGWQPARSFPLGNDQRSPLGG